jgi:hypothetical protein
VIGIWLPKMMLLLSKPNYVKGKMAKNILRLKKYIEKERKQLNSVFPEQTYGRR